MDGMSRRPAYLLLSAVAWWGSSSSWCGPMAFLAGVVVPRTVDGPARTTHRGRGRHRPGPPAAVRRPALGDGASPGEGVAASARSRGGSSAPPTCSPRTSASSCCWCCGNPGAGRSGTSTARPRSSSGRSARPAGCWRSRRRSRSTTSSSPGFGRPAGRAPRDAGITAEPAGRRPPRLRAAPADDRAARWPSGRPPRWAPRTCSSPSPSTGYIAVGVMFEERDLRRTFGASYDAYAARVPALLPGLRTTRRRPGSLVTRP